MPFWLYYTICILTHPFRWLMPFFKWSDLKFATKLLWWNNYKNCWIISQSRLETADFKSQLCEKYNNYFAMGYTKNSSYQKQPTTGQTSVGEPSSFAIYTNVYKSVYDYYDLVSRRNAALGRAINERVPTANFKADSNENQAYLAWVTANFKKYGYFTARLDGYASGVLTKAWDYKPYNFRFILNCIYTLVVPAYLIMLFRSYKRVGNFKDANKRILKNNKIGK